MHKTNCEIKKNNIPAFQVLYTKMPIKVVMFILLFFPVLLQRTRCHYIINKVKHKISNLRSKSFKEVVHKSISLLNKSESVHSNLLKKSKLTFSCPQHLLLLLVFVFATNSLVIGQTTGDYRSRINGNWGTADTWQRYNGTSWLTAVTIPNSTNNVSINHEVYINSGTTVEANNLVLNSQAKLTINGTLIVQVNLTMVNNDPELITGSEARVFILGNAFIANRVNINLSSYFIVAGNFTIDGGGGTDIDINDASIYVFGTFSPGSTGLTSCTEYDNLTENMGEDCDVGNVEAFETNVEDEIIPIDVQEIIYPCTAPVINNPGAQTACDSYTLPPITGTNLTGNQAYFNNSQALGGSEITGTITATQTVWIYDANGTCADEESFLVTINVLPAAIINENNGPLCAGDDAEFDLSGTSGATVTYKINGGPDATLVLSGRNATIVIPAVADNQTLELVSITNGTCTQSLSANATITVHPLPLTGEILYD